MASATSLVLNIIGNNQTAAAMNAAGASVDGLGDKVKKYGMLAAAGAATAAVGITAMAVDFTKAALEDQASAAQLAQTMQKTQGATKDQIQSTEDWISKMGVATGMADDKLRPALAGLMIAGRTSAQAQSDVAVAMDIAAAKGVDLESVTNAMSKAAMGNTGALGKLGVATKDAAGEALSYDQILANASATMGGASAAAANTTAGRFARLSLVVSELKETIGYALLPILTNVAGWFLDKGVPALTSFGNLVSGFLTTAVQGLTSGFKENDVTSTGLFGTFEMLGTKVRAIATWVTGTLLPALANLWSMFKANILPVLLSFGTYITGTLIPGIVSFGGWLVKYKGWLLPIAVGIGAIVAAFKIYQGVVTVITAVTKIYTAVQAALNVVMSLNPIGLIVIALIGLVAGLIYAYQTSDTFRAVVDAAFQWVLNIVQTVWHWVSDNWPLLLAILTGPIGLAVLAIVKNWDTIKEAVSGVKDWIVQKWDEVVGFITGIPGRISAIASTMWNGITQSISTAKDWVGDRVDDILGFFTGLPGRITEAASGMWDGIGTAFKSTINRIIGWWNNLSLGFDGFTMHIPMAPDISVPGFSIGTPNIPMLAKGGIVTGPTLAMIGEGRHPEAVIPLDGKHGLGGGDIHIHLEGAVVAGPEAEAWIVSTIRKAVQSRGGNVSVLAG